MIGKIKKYFIDHPEKKQAAMRLLQPKNQARPRWWVRTFLVPLLFPIGKGATICRSVRKDILPINSFSLGSNSTIEDYVTLNNGLGSVKIGNNTRVGIGSVVIGPVHIGNDIIIAQNVVISGMNHGYEDITIPIKNQPCGKDKITLKDGCWIGANSTLVSGVTIGKNAVVAGGSVVTKSVPDYTVIGGNPAKVLKLYNSETGVWKKVV